MHYVPGPFLKKQHRNSLEKGRGYPLSFSYIRMTYRAKLRTENGGTTGYNSYKDRSFFCEACGLHYGKEKNYDFIYIVSVAVIILFLYPGNIIRIPALIIPIPTGIKMIVQQKITPTPDRMRPMGNRISSHTQAFKIAPVILYAIPNKMITDCLMCGKIKLSHIRQFHYY